MVIAAADEPYCLHAAVDAVRLGVVTPILVGAADGVRRAADEAGLDVALVGDSLGQVVLGYDSTLPVTLEDMVHHTKAAVRGVRRAMVFELLMAVGIILSATLTPPGKAIHFGFAGSGTCDLTRLGPAPLGQLLAVNGHDDVTYTEAGLLRRATRIDLCDSEAGQTGTPHLLGNLSGENLRARGKPRLRRVGARHPAPILFLFSWSPRRGAIGGCLGREGVLPTSTTAPVSHLVCHGRLVRPCSERLRKSTGGQAARGTRQPRTKCQLGNTPLRPRQPPVARVAGSVMVLQSPFSEKQSLESLRA
jgi:hypothetical protein